MNPQSTLNEPGFPGGWNPVEALTAFMADRNARVLVGWLLVFVVFFLWRASPEDREAERERGLRDAIEFDDEPLDDEDHAAFAERDTATHVPLDEYFEHRTKRATVK